MEKSIYRAAMVDWVGLTVPLAYLSILVGSLATFSSLYRKRKVGKSLHSIPPPQSHITPNDVPQRSQFPSNHGSANISSATSTSHYSTSNPTPPKKNPPPFQRACSKRLCSSERPRISGGYSPYGTPNPHWPTFWRAEVSETIYGSDS